MTYEEFERMVTETGPEIYSFCLQLARNRSEADELYQDTMLAAVERRGRISLTGNPRSYLIGVAIGLWKNMRRKIARRSRIHPESPLEDELEEVYPEVGTQSPEEKVLEQEEVTLVRKAVAGLPERYRILVVMYYSGGLSVEGIAAAVHIPKGTVKSRLHKAREIIRNRMEAEGYEIK